MARTLEFLKKSEARIIIYLANCGNEMKCGRRMSEKLKIDYIYIMKLLDVMYNKGWLTIHKYNNSSYFELTRTAPKEMAIEIMTNPQSKLTGTIEKIGKNGTG